MGGSRGRLISLEHRSTAITLISEACDAGARKHLACEILEISVRTIERWEKDMSGDKRKQAIRLPINKLTPDERNKVLLTVNSDEYRDLPPCKIVPSLADNNIYIASEATFYRILREEKLLTHRNNVSPIKRHKPTGYIASGPNQVWSWDISFLPTTVTGLFVYLYVIVDIFSRKIVGWNVHETQSADNAAKLINQAYLDEKIKPGQVVLHSDNGKPMKGMTMLATLQFLGVVPSFSRPSVSDDNPFSESLFKTFKYCSGFSLFTKFENITDAIIWCEKFVAWYNNEHLHSGLKFITPNQRHNGESAIILANRHNVYEQAKAQKPERWSKQTRNWVLPNVVTLNPDKKLKAG